MDLRKLSLLLLLVGSAITLSSLLWFVAAFAETLDFVGEYGGGDMGGELLACLYSSPAICEGAAFLSDAPSYSPTLFWLGMVATLAGLIVRFSLSGRPGKNSTANPRAEDDNGGSAAAVGNVLGFIPERSYTRIVYILTLTGAVGGLLMSPLLLVAVAGFALALLGLLVFQSRLSGLDSNHLAALCVVAVAAWVLLLLARGSFLFLLVALAQIALFYIGFNSYRRGRTIGADSLKKEARLAIAPLERWFSKQERDR